MGLYGVEGEGDRSPIRVGGPSASGRSPQSRRSAAAAAAAAAGSRLFVVRSGVRPALPQRAGRGVLLPRASLGEQSGALPARRRRTGSPKGRSSASGP